MSAAVDSVEPLSDAQGGPIAAPALRVVWLGDAPPWIAADGAQAELAAIDVDVLPADAPSGRLRAGGAPSVIHVGSQALGRLRELRRAFPDGRLVLDLTLPGESELGRRAARNARLADAIVLGSLEELRRFRLEHPKLAAAASVVPRAIDLDAHAPLAQLAKTRDTQIKRFRRVHRLAGPSILFAGPYTPEGGLDDLLRVYADLRARTPELRLLAIPHGRVDQRYLDQCERVALGFGHKVVIEWTVPAEDVPLWYAVAHVVCLPYKAPLSSDPAQLAAAAARPIVGRDVPSLSDWMGDDDTAGFLVPADDVETLGAALEALIGDKDEAARLGSQARERVERELSPSRVARSFRQLWADVGDRRDQPVR